MGIHRKPVYQPRRRPRNVARKRSRRNFLRPTCQPTLHGKSNLLAPRAIFLDYLWTIQWKKRIFFGMSKEQLERIAGVIGRLLKLEGQG
jgi:hypothetical protein